MNPRIFSTQAEAEFAQNALSKWKDAEIMVVQQLVGNGKIVGWMVWVDKAQKVLCEDGEVREMIKTQ